MHTILSMTKLDDVNDIHPYLFYISCMIKCYKTIMYHDNVIII